MKRSSLARTGFKRKVYIPAPAPPLVPVQSCNTANTAEHVETPKEPIFRSEPYRRYVADQECFCCRLVGFSQCAHENFGKALSRKVCDSRTFPACGPHHGLIGCHQQFDLGIDASRDDRRELGARYVAEMRARAVKDGWRFEPDGIKRRP